MRLYTSLSIIVVSLSLPGCKSPESPQHRVSSVPEIISVRKIWDAGNHNAFTDLINFKGRWFCTFREADRHQGTSNGKIRVLTSNDGEHWESASLLSEEGIDLRDPKLSITPNHRLMLVMGGSVYNGGRALLAKQPRVAFSSDGRDWSRPERVCSEGDWLWRVTWHNGRAYGIVYRTGSPDWVVRLVSSEDGVHYKTVSDLAVPDRPNESTVRFLKNGDCVALVRREAGDEAAWIGVSAPPYTAWKWASSGMFVGGPNFIILKNGDMIAGGRQKNPPPVGPKTFLGRMDLQTITPQIILPSGGDTSYPGLVWQDGLLWVSYYSSHEGKTSIYLAKVRMPVKGRHP